MKLEDIKLQAQIAGLRGDEAVSVVSVKWYGTEAVEVTYKTRSGSVDHELLYRHDEDRLSVASGGRPWTFDGDGADYRLVAEAQRIRLAHLFDPHLAVHSSFVEPLPHQITAVYESMLPRQPLRFLLADDPGAGKTIMAGLLIRELMARGDVERCLIVCPGILDEQWQDELQFRFNLPFELLTRDKIEASGRRNWFAETNLVIARLDKLSRNEELQEMLASPGAEWDLVVCDEAHKMSATYTGGEIKYTKRYRLGQNLSGLTRHFLLMTATPHNGKETDFQLFMALLDGDRFEGRFRDGVHKSDVSDMMRRMVKERLVRFNGKPLFPERLAHTIHYKLSKAEDDLYASVTEYVREEFNRADELVNDNRRRTVGFALTMLQRRLASSPEAIYQSLRRRRERLEARIEEEELVQRGGSILQNSRDGALDVEALQDLEDVPDNEFEKTGVNILDRATAAQSIAELQAEIRTLKVLERCALTVRNSGTDTKWGELAELLRGLRSGRYSQGSQAEAAIVDGLEPKWFPDPYSPRHKLVVFTEHVDTLEYLLKRITTLTGQPEAVVVIHGGIGRKDRLIRQEQFRNDPGVQLLLATDAAGEGINLQRAHFMVNYDLPWNPNRLEQRFGRIHRIGQTEVCQLWNLVAFETREGGVYLRLLEKLEQARKALSGQVYDVLGKLEFEGRPLRELLLEAIRYGERPDVKARLDTVIDGAIDRNKLKDLIEDKHLVTGVMDTSTLTSVRLEMERAEARRLQPHYIESFFREAFSRCQGTLRERESGRFEVKHVPPIIRNRDRVDGRGAPVLPRYERITFEKSKREIQGKPLAEFVTPGHPLLLSTLKLILEMYGGLLKQGAALVDEKDSGTKPRVLFSVEHAIQDGTTGRSGERRIISKRVLYVEINAENNARHLHYAPYLDYRPLGNRDPSIEAILSRTECDWIRGDMENLVQDYAIRNVVPEHLNEVREARQALVEKTKRAVKERLTREINYWDARSHQLKMDEAAGKKTARMHWVEARRRADDLDERLRRRMRELALEAQVSPRPPVVLGGLLVVPQGLIGRIQGNPQPSVQDPVDTQRIAAEARRVVMKIERQLGYNPIDRELEKVGYDIESRRSDVTRFIEVKGRRSDADDVQVTRNEILYSLNKPEQYILALVLFDKSGETVVRYRRRPFSARPDFGVTSVRYSMKALMADSQDPMADAGRGLELEPSDVSRTGLK